MSTAHAKVRLSRVQDGNDQDLFRSKQFPQFLLCPNSLVSILRRFSSSCSRSAMSSLVVLGLEMPLHLPKLSRSRLETSLVKGTVDFSLRLRHSSCLPWTRPAFLTDEHPSRIFRLVQRCKPKTGIHRPSLRLVLRYRLSTTNCERCVIDTDVECY